LQASRAESHSVREPASEPLPLVERVPSSAEPPALPPA